ncbi:hypothetical protein GCM10009628_25960 [Paeniglutamicibacter kerguelensis]|uniref:Uncharacterized protein n=1 Tax=Paeniglutamicibacter kerguelensis TaxID=254788 RepID=A0ABS4XB62_9MICC|nr:hypothetical protein [Paeniglutamicibacter kerguelensis]
MLQAARAAVPSGPGKRSPAVSRGHFDGQARGRTDLDGRLLRAKSERTRSQGAFERPAETARGNQCRWRFPM